MEVKLPLTTVLVILSFWSSVALCIKTFHIPGYYANSQPSDQFLRWNGELSASSKADATNSEFSKGNKKASVNLESASEVCAKPYLKLQADLGDLKQKFPRKVAENLANLEKQYLLNQSNLMNYTFSRIKLLETDLRENIDRLDFSRCYKGDNEKFLKLDVLDTKSRFKLKKVLDDALTSIKKESALTIKKLKINTANLTDQLNKTLQNQLQELANAYESESQSLRTDFRTTFTNITMQYEETGKAIVECGFDASPIRHTIDNFNSSFDPFYDPFGEESRVDHFLAELENSVTSLPIPFTS